MSIKVSIFHSSIKQIIGQDAVTVSGNTVGECLADLIRQYPDVQSLIFDEQGQLLRQVFVHVNIEGAHKISLAEPVKQGDELILAVLLTGG
jgi:molybdopterin converting factor small subunit